jgi:hypothetical protein
MDGYPNAVKPDSSSNKLSNRLVAPTQGVDV